MSANTIMIVGPERRGLAPYNQMAGQGGGDPGAKQRVHLAAERTFLSWIRTALALMAFGFVVARFGLFLREFTVFAGRKEPLGPPAWLGVVLVGLGVVSTIAAGVQYVIRLRRLDRGEEDVGRQIRMSIVLAATLAVIGAATAVYLAVS